MAYEEKSQTSCMRKEESMLLVQKREHKLLPGNPMNETSIFVSQHSCLTQQLPKLFKDLPFRFANKHGRNFATWVSKDLIGEPVPRNGSPRVIVDHVGLNNLKQERNNFGELECSPGLEEHVNFPVACNKDRGCFWMPKLCVQTLGFDGAIRVYREGIDVIKNVLAVVVRAEKYPIQQALAMFAAQWFEVFVKAISAEKLIKRVPDRVRVNSAAVVTVNLIERVDSLVLKVFRKLKNVVTLEMFEHFVLFVRNSKSHNGLHVLVQSCTNTNFVHTSNFSAENMRRLLQYFKGESQRRRIMKIDEVI